ncbi:MAG: glycosyltransferase family 39 protein [Patescibacteria group bacterium]
MNSTTALFDYLKKTIKRSDIILTLVFAVVYFTTRLTNLLKLPIFSDEGIYIRWAKIASDDPAWRFISLTDGKQPLQTWGTIPFIKLFPDNLLFAGRLFSVMTGYAALLGMMALCAYLYGRRGAIIAGILYIVTPYFLFYDRLALVDSGVNASFIWILFLSILLPKFRRFDLAMIFGFIAGIGLLAKSSVIMFLGLSVFGILILIEESHPHLSALFSIKNLITVIKKNKSKILDYYSLFVIVFGISLSLYLTQKFFSPFFHYIAEKNLTFIESPSEWLAHPFSLVPSNLQFVPLYVGWESGWLPMILGIAGLMMMFKKRPLLAMYLSIWIILPFLLIINFNKVIFPRYLIFFPSILIILTVTFLNYIKDRSMRFVSIVVSTLLLAGLSYPILFNVTAISLPPVDRGQYIEGQTAVWGAQELMQIIRDDVAKTDKQAVVLAEGNFGLIADVLEVMKKPGDRIIIEGYWPLNEEHIYQKLNETDRNLVYIVFSHRNDFPVHWREVMDEVKVFKKPGSDPSAVYLYKLKNLPVNKKIVNE